MSSTLTLKKLTKKYRTTTVLKGVDLEIPSGQFTSVLGPSGCGKSTVLMLIAGIVSPTDGHIVLDGRDITNQPVETRNIGIVFQNYALFPNLTVRDNILYGLYGKADRQEQNERLKELLKLTSLEGLENRLPQELSGGQQQRVAIARALAPQPKLLLLDEPLSALDAWARADIGKELRQIQKRSGVTTVMVTHDRSEALALSDYLVVMKDGKVEQAGTPELIYDHPNTGFVATFVGGMNVLRLADVNHGKLTGIRYGEARLFEPTELTLSYPYSHVGKIESIEFMGDFIRISLLLNDFKTLVKVDAPRNQLPSNTPEVGELLVVQFPESSWRAWEN